jgi:hypothetical protein
MHFSREIDPGVHGPNLPGLTRTLHHLPGPTASLPDGIGRATVERLK